MSSTKTTKKKSAPKIDFAAKKAEALEAVEKMHGRLAEGILSEDDWKVRLAFMARLHNYSARNSLLMWAQWEERKEVRMFCRAIEAGIFGAPLSPALPELTYPAGASTWGKMAGPDTPRNGKGDPMPIAKGEKALSVLAPFTVTDRDKEPDPVTGKYPTKVIGFVLKNRTFDISQTVGIEAPASPVKLLTGEGPSEVWDALVALAEEDGWSVQVVPVPGSANGDCTYSERRIRIETANEQAQRIKTLVHEIAHKLLHDPEVKPKGMPREVSETEAESVAYAVCNLIGFDTSDYSLGYVTSWSKNDGALLASTLERVAVTTAQIIGYLETGELPKAKSAAKYDFEEVESGEAAVVA